MKAPLRILVLTSSTGGGHDARAQAFVDWVNLVHPGAAEVAVARPLEGGSTVGATGVAAYNRIQRSAPFLHHPFYLLVENLAWLHRRTVVLGRRRYLADLHRFRPHLVFSVHDCLNRGYFALARRVLGPGVRCATYCGEFSGGYGFSRNWVDPTADLFLVRTRTAGDYAIRLGMPRRQVRVRGHFLAPRASFEILPPAARRAYRLQQLGLDPDRFTLLCGTGGAGANNHLEVAPVLERFSGFLQAIFVCGHNERTRTELTAWTRAHPRLRCVVLGYTQVMHLLLQVSDAVFTRGGTTTCAKALHFGCPVLFNAFGGVMPQERLTLKYFLHGHGGLAAASPGELAEVLERWREEPDTYAGLRGNLLGLSYGDDSRAAVADLVGLAEGAAGVQLGPAADGRTSYRPSEEFLAALALA